MTIEQGLRTYLLADAVFAALSVKVYPRTSLGENVASPYVTYQRISTDKLATVDGPSNWQTVRMQIDIWDGSDDARAASTADAIELAVDGYKGLMGTVDVRATRLLDRDTGFEDASSTHRVRLDFSITHRV